MHVDTFKDFFRDHFFYRDKKYVDISMKGILQEMAIPHDIAKKPIKIDKDDIQFLSQFPSKYWTQALHMRYSNDLADALEERTSRRTPAEKKMYERLKSALFSGNYHTLNGVVSAELITRLHNKEYGHVIGNEELTEKAAAHLAELETEKVVPHAIWPETDPELPPGYKRYKFKRTTNSKDYITIVAKPFINRLVHKIERTRDHEHHPESGLNALGTTHGQYGYDLYDLKRGEDGHVTRGMNLPKAQEIRERVREYLAHNAHRMYGNLPDGDDIVWKPVGEGGRPYKDNWSWEKVENPLFSSFVARLQSANPGEFELPDGTKVPPQEGFQTNKDRRKAAQQLARAEVIRKIEAGEISGPPIPGIAPEGLKVKVIGGKIVAPPLYLPHKKGSKIRVETPEGIDEKIEDIPLVNPAEYLRELGTEEGDESIDASLLRGHQKDYVHVPHNEYKKAKGYVAGGALHVNQNSGGRMYLDPSDPEYMDRKSEIEDDMGTCGLDAQNRPVMNGGEGVFFFDIIKGIWHCVDSSCGGGTDHEKGILKQSVPDLHTMVYQKMMMNLRDENLDTSEGRKKFAKNIAASWVQQDLGQGGGTRRLRRLTEKGRTMSFDATTTGDSGATLSLADTIQQNMVGRLASDFASDKKGRGEKNLPAGQHQFSYHIDNYRQILSDFEKEAANVDAEREKVVKMSRSEISDQIADLMGNAITDKAALILQLQFYLKQLFIAAGYPPNEAEGLAEQRIETYGADRADARKIIANFKTDVEIQKMFQEPESEEAPQSALVQGEVEKIRTIIDQMDDVGTLNDKNAQDKVYELIRTHVPEQARPACIAVADEEFGRKMVPAQPIPVKTPVFKEDRRAANLKKIQDLIDSKNWLALARNSNFYTKVPSSHIEIVIKNLTAAQAKIHPDEFDHDAHGFAILRLQRELRERELLQSNKIEWTKIREMVGTGAIYNGEKAQDSKRDYNWFGAPETAGMTQNQAKKHMNKNVKKGKK